MQTSDLPLGRHVDYPREYDASLLFPIARSLGRGEIGLDDAALPFTGHDRWHAYELGWLDLAGKPRVATATLTVPADSPHLIESKSLKLYLNSFNASRFDHDDAVRERIADDLSRVAGAPVAVAFGLPGFDSDSDPGTPSAGLAAAPPDARGGNDAGAAVHSIDDLPVAIDHYGPPRADFLAADAGDVVEETLSSALLKSNCPVTGQPDWARVLIHYEGPRLDRAELLRYLVSFRDHCEFHEQCVERIFADLTERAAPHRLSVEARYTRRGGLDINPWRATPGTPPPSPTRAARQ